MPKIIFAVDAQAGQHPLRSRARFLRYLDELRVMGKLTGTVDTGIGHWVDPDGISWLEYCYVLDREDFKARVQKFGHVNNQQCVLVVTDSAAHLDDLKGGPLVLLGAFTCVGKTMPAGDWTRFDSTGDYWQARP